MPKELINHARTPDDTGMQATVHWSPETGEVQLGVALDASEVRTYLKTATETAVHWYTAPLTRREINQAIRALRRARDSVYGADE